MIVMFQGVHNSHNGAAEACCIAAVMSATKYNRKTLLLQLTSSDALSVEKFLIGKDLEEEEAIQKEANELYRIDDRGIDALIRRAGSAKLTKDHFDSSCRPLLRYENMLDCAGITKSHDFTENLTVKEVKILLKHAGYVYDNIFILLDGKNQLITPELLDLCDTYITCLQQSPQRCTFNQTENKKTLFAVPNYDSASVYNSLYLKKKYGAKKIYVIGQNTGFKDACLEGTLLKFMLKNINNTNGDDNFSFMKNVTALMDGIMDKEDWSEAIPEAIPLKSDDAEQDIQPAALRTVEEGDFTKETVKVKKGLFFKRDKTVIKLKKQKKAKPKKEKDKKKKTVEEAPVTDSSSVMEDTHEEPAAFTEISSPAQEVYTDVLMEDDTEDEPIFDQEEPLPAAPEENPRQPETESNIADTVRTFTPADLALGTLAPEGYLTGIQRAASRKAADTKWSCPECGAMAEGDYCDVCGSAKPKRETPVPGEWICPSCGNRNTTMFCSRCGTQK